MHKIVMAIDPGTVVNPLSVEQQVESAVVYGLTAALYGEITIKDGRVEQSNFNDYEMLRMAQMPKVETVLMPSGGFWGGVGEPPVAVVAPALCNAIFAATGQAHPLAAAEEPRSEESLSDWRPAAAAGKRGDYARRSLFVIAAMLLAWTGGALAADAPPGASSCTGCHPAARSVATPVPRLIGRDAAQIVAAMTEFKSGKRPTTIMDRIAKGFTEDETKAIAAWFAAQKD